MHPILHGTYGALDKALCKAFRHGKERALLIYLAVEGRVYVRKNLSEQFGQKGMRGILRQPCALLCSTCVIYRVGRGR